MSLLNIRKVMQGLGRGTGADDPSPDNPGNTAVGTTFSIEGINLGYVDRYPADQCAMDIFRGSWRSRLPVEGLESGTENFFEDYRIRWAIETLGGLAGADVLELGPMEGLHTAILAEAGAAQVTAIDSSVSAFLRCLIVKEVLRLDRARFLLGNFETYLRDTPARHDLIVACGVLYHLTDPLAALLDMMRVADRIFIWSVFYDRDLMSADDLAHFRGAPSRREIGADSMTYHPRPYGPATDDFIGGIRRTAAWVRKAEVVALLERHGFRVTLGHKRDDHLFGPAACILARR
ncbi:MAG: methyltransferase type 12 [Enterovirga sp.]|nr:methyltransferase type 12 [Enterovirga sp.]